MGEQEESRELVRSDINLEKWAVFATNKHAGERTLTRTTPGGTQQVKIGMTVRDGKNHTLTAGDGKVFYALLKKWEEAGKPVNEPVRFTIRSLSNDLSGHDDRGTAIKLKSHLKNISQVPIEFIESYKIPDGEDTISTYFTLLGSLKIFERRRKPDGTIEKYFGFSEFKIHETIMDTILKKGIKPIRLDVIRTLKSDCAFILYRYLDLMLFGNPKHEEDLLDIAKICDLKEGQRTRKIKETISHALKELKNKEITTGRIASAEILESKTPSGWKISITKGKQLPGLPAGAGAPEAKDETKKLQDYFENLPVEEQELVRRQAEERAEGTLFYRSLNDENKQAWIEGEIQSILKERMVKPSVPPVVGQQPESRPKAKKERKEPAQRPRKVPIKITYRNAQAVEVKVAGEWGNWEPEDMSRSGPELWERSLELLPGTYKYKLVVDGVWMSNPEGEKANDQMGNNLLIVS